MKKIVAVILSLALIMSGVSFRSIDSYAEDVQETYEDDQTVEEIPEENANYGDANSDLDDDVDSAEQQNVESENTEMTDDGLGPQSMEDANSWRYQNGQKILSNVVKATSPNAWKKVNGVFVNSQGNPIPGATLKGMDVSYAQGKIDWETVKKSDIDYVIIQCGFGNNDSSQDDRYWQYNVSECERLGIPYGVYLYSYAYNTTMANSEADHVLRLLKGHTPDYPVYLDMEDSSTIKAGNTTLGNIAKIFCDKIAAAGYTPGIYANLNWWNVYLTSPVFDNTSWSKWVAQFNVSCDYTGDYDMWQCTEVGRVDGVTGNVDLDFWMEGNSTPSNSKSIISVSSHQQTYGWLPAVGNGEQSGVTGESKRLEAFKISVSKDYPNLGIKYRAHVSSVGWQNWVSNGVMAGTTGQAKAVEAIEISLTGRDASKYDVYYRVHSQSFGWLGWAKNGASAGSTGLSRRVEAIQVKVVPKGSAAPGSTSGAFKTAPHVSYRVHQQTYGWLPWVKDREEAGVTGQAKRMEAIEITLSDDSFSGSIQYRTHQQTYGWLPWVKDGEEAGITGQAKRMEAIQIKLTGDMAKQYDVYYRVHVQSYGWLGWAKNGASAGTEGLAKRMEAIEIVLVAKGKSAPGSTARAFIKK